MTPKTDQHIDCRECGQGFVFTLAEQEFFASIGLNNAPVRCQTCRRIRRAEGRNERSRSYNGAPMIYETTCAECGGTAEVPFRPKGYQPVYCNACFHRRRDSVGG